MDKPIWCAADFHCAGWPKCLEGSWLPERGDGCDCGKRYSYQLDPSAAPPTGIGQPDKWLADDRQRNFDTSRGAPSGSPSPGQPLFTWGAGQRPADYSIQCALKIPASQVAQPWVSTTDVQKQVAPIPVPLNSISVVFQSGAARGQTAGKNSNQMPAWVFETACNTHGDFLKEAIRRYSKRQHHWLQPLVEMEDLYQEAFLELRILCQRRPLDLFGTESSIRRMLNCLARRIVTNQVRKSKASKRDTRVAHPRPAQLARLKLKYREGNQLDLVALIETAKKILERLRLPDREAVRLRMLNYSWDEIARTIGGSPDGNRMAYVRAIRRLRERLDPEEMY